MARDRISASERAAVREVRDLAADAAIQATRKLLGQHLSTEQAGASALLDSAISDLPQALKASNEAGSHSQNAA